MNKARSVGISQRAQYLRDLAEEIPSRLTTEEAAAITEAADMMEALLSALHEKSMDLETVRR